MHVTSSSNKVIKPVDSEKGKKNTVEDTETVTPITNSDNQYVKLRNSILEERRKSTRFSDADVGRHGDLFAKNNVESLSVVILDSEPINRNKKANENVIKNGTSLHDYINKNVSETTSVQV